ncbi:MAG: capsular polysaccharide biosynthesis protein [Paracoccaceae bacterium]
MTAGQQRRLGVYSAGFWRQGHVRRILELAGWQVVPFASPASSAAIGVWGRTGPARRGRVLSRLSGAALLTVEDAFLRSLHPGVRGEAPVGLVLDGDGVFYDASRASGLEKILGGRDLRAGGLQERAAAGRALLQRAGISKYNPVPRGHGDPPEPGYVLVVDQRRGDASVRYGRASARTFERMLAAARAENPGRRVVIRSHPHGRSGYLDRRTEGADVSILATPANPWDLLEGAHAVYCVTSQMGFEAVLAGHRPHLFGVPFYAGWGLTEDRQPCPRRARRLSADELFAGAMLLYPTWYDPVEDRLCGFETAAERLADHAATAWRDLRPAVCTGFRRWKRPHMRRFLQGCPEAPAFVKNPRKAVRRAAATANARVVVWATREAAGLAAAAKERNLDLVRTEDGFLRSVGLGADLLPPMSLVFDDRGIHYDPAAPSRLEMLIERAAGLPRERLFRAARLRAMINAAGVTKYNLRAETGGNGLDVPKGSVLVVGQVEDDASVAHVGPKIGGNAGLLRLVRESRPGATILYKPHPDAEAGLRPGRIPPGMADGLADAVIRDTGIEQLYGLVGEVWTMSSLAGFEALLRGVAVVCLGTPFYAGWGLTEDRGPPCPRRTARPSLDALVHAALIEYPVYLDPRSGMFIPPEIALRKLSGRLAGCPGNLARLQRRAGLLGRLWRSRRTPVAQDVAIQPGTRSEAEPGQVR